MNVPLDLTKNRNLRSPKQEDAPPSLHPGWIDTGAPKKEEVSTPPPTPLSLRGGNTNQGTITTNQGQPLFKDVRRSNHRRASLFTIDEGTDLREVSPGIEEHYKRKDAERSAYLQRVGDEIFWSWTALSSEQVLLFSFLLVTLQLVIIKAPIKTESKCRIALWIISNLITIKVLNAFGIIPDMCMLGGVITSNILIEFRRWVTR